MMCALFAVVLALSTVLVLGVASAGAAVIHLPEGSFNGQEAPGGAFGGILSSDAVDLSDGDVYVAEAPDPLFLPQSRVVEFNREGVYGGVEITGVGTPHGAFEFASLFGSSTSEIAVDNTVAGANRGDLYVADTEHHVLDRFGQSGEFVCQVAGSETEAETPAAKECNGAKGSELSSAITPGGVAVDASGDVFVTDDAHEAIEEFGPSGEFLSQLKDPHFSNEMRTIAFDPSGALYVLDASAFFNPSANVLKFEGGHFVSILNSKPSSGFGIDPSTGRVYVSDQVTESEHEIAEYEPSGALRDVTSLGPKDFGSIAVGSAGKLYGTESPLFSAAGAVQIYSGDLVVPNVTTGAATSVGETTATLGGIIDPDTAHGGGEVTECKLEYGPTEGYGQTAPCAGGAPFSGVVAADLVGLRPSSVYHFRIEAANSDRVPGHGADGTFTTSGAPAVDVESAHVDGTRVHLRAKIDPFGLDTTCQLQYVEDASFVGSGWSSAVVLPCSPEDLGAGLGDQEVSATVSGLQIATTYHYRFLATNRAGLTGAGGGTFATFGANGFKFALLDREGAPFTQAAGHPYELVTSFEVNQFLRNPDEPGVGGSTEGVDGNLKDVMTELPAGLIGDPEATPKCSRARVLARECPGSTQVGVIEVNLEGEAESPRLPVYNVVPPKGVAAEFAATPLGKANLIIDAKLRSGGDYGVTAESANITALAAAVNITLKMWGVPADASHDNERVCALEVGCSAEAAVLRPFLRAPTSCVGGLLTSLVVDSWQEPGLFSESSVGMPAMMGCKNVGFTPSVLVRPSSGVADSPTGLHVDVHVPQNDAAEGVGEADLRDAQVVFPAGLVVNPSSADGLEACSEAQVGFTGFAELEKPAEPGVRTAQFTSGQAECPAASKLGTVEVDTPLFDHSLPGAIYLARQGENPFGSLLAVYITVFDPVTGIVVKLPGEVRADPVTGQLSTTVQQSPQAPFEDFKIDLFSGARAALSTPSTCGMFTSTSLLTPWSVPAGGAVSSSDAFEVTQAPGGAACPSSPAQQPNAPSFTAGTFSPVAGTYSPFVLRLAREDDSQTLQALNVTLPEGLVGKLAGVERCPEADIQAAQARDGEGQGHLELQHASCPAGSEVGVAHVGAGSGAPFYVTGKAYLAGPYQGAPLSLVVVTPAVAGPFDLGVVVVRSALFIDPATAQVTVKSDPFPTILDGIPLDIRSIAVEITRSQFTLNPTSCEKMQVSGTAFAAVSQAPFTAPFQVGGCNGLSFKPALTAITAGKTSKVGGASLTVRVAQKPGEANIHKVDLQLPIALPARLTTLQKACTEAQFNANPAGCPAGSTIGSATAITPLLGVPVTGPAILVSHGGAAFPDVEFLLQGEGIHVTLDGKTDIKMGVTYSRFETVPDVPISSFETTLPQGPHSILGTNLPATAKGSLCAQKLTIPTSITGQNGAVLDQNTKIAVSGCPKVRTVTSTRAQKLSKALKVCRKHYRGTSKRERREACEKQAKKRYAPSRKTTKKTKKK
jgi:hypothetical protein